MTDAAPPAGLLEEARTLAGGREWSTLVERLGSVSETELFAEPEVAFLLADALWRTGSPDRAVPLAERVLALAGRRGDRRLSLRALNVLGVALFESGRMPEAEGRFAELLERASDWGDVDFAARASNGLGALAHLRGRRDEGLAYFQRAISGYTRMGNRRGLAQTHYNLGLAFRDLGFDADADAHYRRAMDFAAESDTEEVAAIAEAERALLRARSGDGRLAESMALRALERFERLSDPTGTAQVVRVLAAAARANGDDAGAEAHLARALELARSHPDPVTRADVQRDRGLLLRDLGRAAEAREALEEAVAGFDQVGATAEAGALRAILAGLPEPPS
ncbi:MAG TPA: tetratricopeptide repeat protein [Longimicrobium sp.]